MHYEQRTLNADGRSPVQNTDGINAVGSKDKIAGCAATQQVIPLPNLDLEGGSGTQKYRDKDKKMGEGGSWGVGCCGGGTDNYIWN